MARKLGAALGLAALAIILLTEFTDIDMQLARAAYDPVLREFPLRHAFLTETVGHRYVRNLCVLAGAGVLGAVLFDLRFAVMDPWTRARMRVLALCAVLVPLAVSLLKQTSALSCPWDLAAFNGSQPYFRLFEPIVPGAAAGHCWPGGHASGALWMLGLVVFWLPHRPRRAAAVAGLLLAIGFGVGWIQQLRGAHFLSHTLWSMWIAAAVTAALWYTMIRARPHALVPRHGLHAIAAPHWGFSGRGGGVDGNEYRIGNQGQAACSAGDGAGQAR